MDERRGSGVIGGVLAIVLLIVGLFGVVALGAWLFSFKGVDSGEVAIVREGGPFDGRAIKEVRQPGQAAKPIGAFNKQDTLPTTQRDLTDEAGTLLVPTADGVNVVVDGQALFQLKTDPELVKKFYLAFGRRNWGGKPLSDPEGFVNFQKTRLLPVLYQSLRQTLGTYDCTSLNNTCIYVLNADSLLSNTGEDSEDKTGDAAEKAKQVNVSQNLAEAEQKITDALQANLKASLGDDYFEGVRFQNLRVVFTKDIQQRVQEAQGKRAEVATARLEAERKTQEAEGRTAVAKEEAKQIEARANAYKNNEAQQKIDQIKAFCGEDGCDPQVVSGGGDAGGIINQLVGK